MNFFKPDTLIICEDEATCLKNKKYNFKNKTYKTY